MVITSRFRRQFSWLIDLPRTSAFDKNTQTDKPLTAEELDIIRRLEALENTDANYDPYQPTVEWFTGAGKQEVMPLSAAPEPKRRWIPSKWERQKVCFDGPLSF
jgi:ribosome biogenesis protein ERB1